MNRKRIKLLKERNRIIFIIIILCILTISLNFLFINTLFKKPTGKENITTKLTTESDFLDWFINFDTLYNEKVKTPTYSLNKHSFVQINNFLNNEETNIYFKNNIYYLDESTTLELDINTRSFRYTKYENNIQTEILEVNLTNGKYYVQLINNKNIYKIRFNKDNLKKYKLKNKDNKVIINNSIYGTNNFDW